MIQLILATQVELVVLSVGLVVLYGFRYLIGTAPTYLAAGLYFIFALMVGSSRLAPTVDAASTMTLYGGLLWLPFVLLLIIIYELEDTAAAQRLYLGLVISAVLFLALFMLIMLQPAEPTKSALSEFFSAVHSLVLTQDSRNELLHGIFSQLFLFLLMPIVYQAVLNQGTKYYGVGIFIAMSVYLALTEALGAIFICLTAGSKAYTPTVPAGWFLRLGAVALLAVLGHFFIVANTPYKRKRTRKTLKFMTSFIDFFLSPERMMRSLSEWSERYRVVVENSSDLIMLVTREGKILNANRIATKYIGKVIDEQNFRLDQVIFDADNNPWTWLEKTQDNEEEHETVLRGRVYHYQNLFLRAPNRKQVDLDLNVSHVQLEGQPIAVIIGRDMTAQREEARQRQSQREQMMHSQRLESLGELAGGIAHDFNNLLQSIQISTDALMQKVAPQNEHLVKNIDEGCRRASALTSQLLGFARKGKFHADTLDASALIEHALQLFQPVAKGIVCRTICEPVPLPLFIDEIQLAQVLLNMLINSRDALKDAPEPKRITLRAENAREQMPEWQFRPDRNADAKDYICIHVRYNVVGMSETTRKKLFDPFFTTKPAGHGTGMGLPMAFGCIANHHGWIHVESAPNEGCDMTIFLPRAGTDAVQGGPENKSDSLSPMH
ncbi:MAG: ATP-binding protein [Lentisphaeria bacterium]|nr:ATP-binding protein [Lentisphaeria bacterium]